jgi:biopolymer transport protein TolR
MANFEFTPRQKAYIRKRTKTHELDPSEMAGELNIVPFLDIVTNIIMFLLATTAAVLTIVQLEAHLPTLSRGRSRGAAETGSTLNLSVTVSEEGIIVAGSGGKLAPGCTNMMSGRVITVPLLPNPAIDANTDGMPDVYNWPELTRCLTVVHTNFPDERQSILTADPNVEYRHLVRAMDAIRSDGTVELFPEIMLSGGVR